MDEATPGLSISLVHHDGSEILRACLRSLYAAPPNRSFEVVLVDNASTDGSVAMVQTEFPQVRLLRNTARHGFGENQNAALEVCRGDYILLLNDDTIVHPGALDALCAFLDAHPQTAVVGPRLLHADGSLQVSCYRFPSPLRCLWENLLLTAALPDHPLFGDYRAWPHDAVRDVDFVSGAAMLARRAVITEVGLFDPRFFMYAEETDWQRRMRRQGWKISFCPDAVITHLGGQSSERMRDPQLCEFQRSAIRYIRKYYGLPGVVLQRAAMVFGAGLRLILWAILYLCARRKRTLARDNMRTWARLLRWWTGFGPHEGIAELARRSASAPSKPITGVETPF
jgi:GT2 family glycosyltransferase